MAQSVAAHIVWRFRAVSPQSIVAFARIFLSVCALAAIYADPLQPARNAALTYYLLGGYVLYAVVLAAGAKLLPPAGRTQIVIHAVDIVLFSLLIYLTEGPTSPFFVFFTFALFSAALQWSWRGVAATAVTIGLVYAYLALTDEIDAAEDLARTIVRAAYIFIVGILFTYFSAILERERLRYARLAAWPPVEPTKDQMPNLEPVLAHIARTADVPWLLAAWEDQYEPHLFLVEFDAGTFRASIRQDFAVGQGGLRPGQYPKVVAVHDRRVPDPALGKLLEEHRIERAVVAPMGGEFHAGWLVMARGPETGTELLALASIAALRLSAELDLHQLRLQSLDAAIVEGRSGFARDVHDSLLQSLAAVSLQMKTLEAKAPTQIAQRLDAIRQTVTSQQTSLRALVMAARSSAKAYPKRRPVAPMVAGVLRNMEAQWGCATSWAVAPEDLEMPAATAEQLSLLIAEAIANGVRHGRASRVEVSVEGSDDGIELRISDDGAGLSGRSGSFGHETIMTEHLGSASLRQRAKDMGATIGMSSSPEGLEIRLQVRRS